MPRGPKGEKRPADVIGNAVHVMRIATGEIEGFLQQGAEQGQGRKGSCESSRARRESRNRQNRGKCKMEKKGRLSCLAAAAFIIGRAPPQFDIKC